MTHSLKPLPRPLNFIVFLVNLVINILLFSSHPVGGSPFASPPDGDFTSVGFVNEPFRGRPFNTDNRRQCFNVTIVNDDDAENAEDFTLTIRNAVPSASVNVTPDVATVTILDRDREWDLRLDNT